VDALQEAVRVSIPDEEELLLHGLRNRLNMVGFALHAYRRDGDPEHLVALDQAYQATVELFTQLDALRRAGPHR